MQEILEWCGSKKSALAQAMFQAVAVNVQLSLYAMMILKHRVQMKLM